MRVVMLCVAFTDPVNRLSAKVRAVVALFAPAELPAMFPITVRPGALTALMGFESVRWFDEHL